MARRVGDGVQRFRLDPVQHASEHGAGRLPDQDQDRAGDQKPHQRSASGKPAHTPTAPPRTARLVSPSARAW